MLVALTVALRQDRDGALCGQTAGPLTRRSEKGRRPRPCRQLGLPLPLPARLPARRRRHAAHRHRRSRRQRRVRAGHRAGVRRRGRRARRLPGADAHRLLDRGHPPAGHAARRGRGGAGRDRRGVGGPAAGAGRRRCRCGTATGSTTSPRSCTAGGCWAWRPSRTCRPTASSTSAARSRRATTCAARSGSPARRCRSGPTCCSPPRTCPASSCTSRCARTCGCRCRRARRRRWPGATVLANLSGSPITIGRAESRCLLARSASARCLAAYVYAAAGEGESSTDLAWDGQTMIWENGVAARRHRAVPEGPAARRVADVDLDLLRAERLRMGTFDDNRRTFADRTDAFRTDRVPARPAGRRPGAAPRARAVPVRARRPVAAGAGLLRGLQHPGLRPGAADARDRPPQARHRRVRRAGLHPRADRRRQGDGPGGPPAQRHPRVHPARLRHRDPHQGQRAAPDAGPRRSPTRSSTSPRPRG